MRQCGHSYCHGRDEAPGQPEQQLCRQQEERQTEAQPHAAGQYRCVPHRHAEGEHVYLLTGSLFTESSCCTSCHRNNKDKPANF